MTLAVMATALGGAPIQCGSEASPDSAFEETPGEALYRLAAEFRAAGDEDGWRRTLEHLMAHHPSSRFAASARQDLVDAGVAQAASAEP
jgi:hypothetical protein